MIIQRKFNNLILEDAGYFLEDFGQLWEDVKLSEGSNYNVLANLTRLDDPIGTEYRIIEGTYSQKAKVFAMEQSEVRYFNDNST